MTAKRSYHYRARLVRVVDGDTVDLQVDLGFYMTGTYRFRLLGVDTPELNAKDEKERERAQLAKIFVENALRVPREGCDYEWPLVIHTAKADSFGRWLAAISFWTGSEYVDLSEQLVEGGLGVVR